MEITLSLKKSVEDNANDYFEAGKKFKKKAEGARLAIEKTKEKLELLKKKEAQKLAQEKTAVESKEKRVAKQKWYHKFRWFISSDGFLVIGGRDATTNEIVVKKHTEKDDLVFHTEAPKSPFVVIKSDGKKVPDQTINEAAEFTASFSSMWARGIAASQVFYVNPNQVTKEAQSGEFISRGAFMIYGKKNFIDVKMNLAIGLMHGETEGDIMASPITAAKKHCEKFVELTQGDDKPSDLAKKIQKKLGGGDLDEILRVIPKGAELKK